MLALLTLVFLRAAAAAIGCGFFTSSISSLTHPFTQRLSVMS